MVWLRIESAQWKPMQRRKHFEGSWLRHGAVIPRIAFTVP
jgi:hypothetical protein